MGKIREIQLALPESSTGHPKVRQLKKIGEILDDKDSILGLVAQDLGIAGQATRAKGMAFEQVLRAVIIEVVVTSGKGNAFDQIQEKCLAKRNLFFVEIR